VLGLARPPRSKWSNKVRLELTIDLKVVSKELRDQARAGPQLSERPTPDAVQRADLDGPTPTREPRSIAVDRSNLCR
jgi:hypothetical protein